MCLSAAKKMFSQRQGRLAEMAAADKQAKTDELMRQALTPPEDSEAARQASDNRLKRLQGMRGWRSTFGFGGRGDMPEASIGLKMLMGQ